ncbi:MAG TPA: UbiA family prenyltransferase [Solirubrobacterales bacterium]
MSRTSKLVNFVAQVGRLSLLGTTFIFVLLGVAAAEGDASPGRLAAVLAAAVFFHLSVYAWNDIADLRIDRSQPRRARSPLVSGQAGVRATAAFASGATLAALALAATQGGEATLWMALALAGLLLYDALGKRIAATVCADLVQGLGWAALVVYGATATGETAAVLAWIAAYVVFTILLVNGVHGALRDLANDYRCGARTTAIWLGARPLPNGGAAVPPRLLAYAVALQLTMAAILLGAAVAVDSLGTLEIALVLGGDLAAIALLLRGLRVSGSPERSWLVALAHILLVLMLPLILVAERLDALELLLLLVLFGLPWAAVARPLRQRLNPTGALE